MENSWVREDLMKISGMKLWWYRNILRPIPASWEWWVTTAQLHLCFDDFTRQISENWPCWGGSQDPFLVHSARFLLKVSQYMSKLWSYKIESLFFLSRSCGGHPEPPWPQHLPDKNKFNIWPPRDLGPAPLNAGQILWLDLCATLGVSDAPLMSYKVYKFKENMDYFSR